MPAYAGIRISFFHPNCPKWEKIFRWFSFLSLSFSAASSSPRPLFHILNESMHRKHRPDNRADPFVHPKKWGIYLLG